MLTPWIYPFAALVIAAAMMASLIAMVLVWGPLNRKGMAIGIVTSVATGHFAAVTVNLLF